MVGSSFATYFISRFSDTMKEAKQAIWFQILLIICHRISCHETEDTFSNANSPLETISELSDEIENTDVQFEKFRLGQTEDLKHGNNETGVLGLVRKWRSMRFSTRNVNRYDPGSRAGNSANSEQYFGLSRQQKTIFQDYYSGGSGKSSEFFPHLNQSPESDEEYEDCRNRVPKPTAQRRVKRIVGGRDAGPGRFPWIAYIGVGSKICGGTLLNRFHVVTAAHCVVGEPLKLVEVILGVYNISDMSPTLSTQKFNASRIIAHPSYQLKSTESRYDVAVIRLDRPVDYMPHISPIKLPGKDESFVGQTAWVAGWGALQAAPRPKPQLLQAVDLLVISNRDCEQWLDSCGMTDKLINDGETFASYRGEGVKSTSYGDSGGPLMIQKKDGWYLIGIASYLYSNSCPKPGKPGGYHNVAKTVDWITGEIDSYTVTKVTNEYDDTTDATDETI